MTFGVETPLPVIWDAETDPYTVIPPEDSPVIWRPWMLTSTFEDLENPVFLSEKNDIPGFMIFPLVRVTQDLFWMTLPLNGIF